MTGKPQRREQVLAMTQAMVHALQDLGWSQRKVSRELGVNLRTVERWMSQECSILPRAEVLIGLEELVEQAIRRFENLHGLSEQRGAAAEGDPLP